MSIATNILSKLIKSYGPKMGRVVHTVAEETGIRPRQVKQMIDEAGPLKSQFDWGDIFHHATPIKTPSRQAASRGHDVGKVLKDRPEGYGKLLSPFEEIAPSTEGLLGPGTYFSQNPFHALKMAIRGGDPRMASGASHEPSIIPYILKEGWGQRLISPKEYNVHKMQKLDMLDNYMMSRFYDMGKFTNPKQYQKIITPVSEEGRALRSPLFYGKGEKNALQAAFDDMVPRNERRDLIEKYKKWITKPLPWNPSFRDFSKMDELGLDEYLQNLAKIAARKSLVAEGKIGVWLPPGRWRPGENVIFPGVEKEWVRHPLARYQNEIGGTFASLLPLISMLRGQREE